MKVGVLGAGQLGQMLAQAGQSLDLEFVFYDHNPDACAGQVGELIVGEFDDQQKLTAFAQQVDVVTVEFENVPIAALNHVARMVPVFPDPSAFKVAQDRLTEKQFFTSLNILTPDFYAIDSAAGLVDLLVSHKEPLILKSRRLGYDGKGQVSLDKATNALEAWALLGQVPAIAEQRIKFKREVSIVAVRSQSGDTRYYPLIENVHENGILKRSRVNLYDGLQAKAEQYVHQVLTALNYVGVLAFEFFDVDGELVANEIAPRVHNSGHWTIEGASTSQFENHLRAILNKPLGDTQVAALCVMYNIIGSKPDLALLQKVPDTYLHYYGKVERPGRKLGHVTLKASTEQNAIAVQQILEGRSQSDLLDAVVHHIHKVL